MVDDYAAQITSLLTTLTVPAEPPAFGTLFLWPGLSPDGGANYLPINNGVLQPVLTWGPSCAPGVQPPLYSSWWISAQYVNTVGSDPGFAGCFGGPIMAVLTGDQLQMTMHANGSVWTQTVTDLRSGTSVGFTIDMHGQVQSLAYFLIEGYGQIPVGGVTFTNTQISAVTPLACNPTIYGVTPYQQDLVSTPVSENNGYTCSIPAMTLFGPRDRSTSSEIRRGSQFRPSSSLEDPGWRIGRL